MDEKTRGPQKQMTDTNLFTDRRRGFLQKVGGVAALPGIGLGVATSKNNGFGRFNDYLFSLGVASGDPLPDSVVLWTRLAPKPLAVDGHGGMPDVKVPVKWEVSEDENFRQIVSRGTKITSPEFAHSVHVEVEDLEPAHEYFYRFKVGPLTSPVGRTKTAPAPGESLDTFSFAFASCQAWISGFYTAYEHMIEEDLDLVVHLGDYIYEGLPDRYGFSPRKEAISDLPEVFFEEPRTLERYRLQYSLYKSEAPLQAVHAKFPWIIVPDDHDVDNNYADEDSENPNIPPETFLARRANAYQAWYEHMPVRPSRMPHGPDIPLYRRFVFGDLAEFNVLDTRQYRSNQACGDGIKESCEERLDPSRTLLGDEQQQWLLNNLGDSTATWNVIAQQVVMAQLDYRPGPEEAFNMDLWDGYVSSRERLFSGIVEQGVRNPVVITGDAHQNFVANLKEDFDDPDSATIGTEFVGTSITSGGDGSDLGPTGEQWLAANPHIKYTNNQRGYVRCKLTPEQWRADFRVVPYVSRPESPIRTDASFVVEAGRPGLQQP